MNRTLNEAGHTLHDALQGKGAKKKVDREALASVEDESDDSASERLAEWIETMKLVEKAVKEVPDTRPDRRRASQAVSKMQRELSVEKLHAYVEDHVRATCTSPVRAAFVLLTGDYDKFEDALAGANSIPDDEARDIRLSKSKLREVLREFYHPSNATLAEAEVAQEHWMFFHRPALGSATATRKSR